MILDALDNAPHYFGLSPGIAAALRFLLRPQTSQIAPGRHELEDGLYAIVQQYHTKPCQQCFWEAHRKHIDVQFVQAGLELIGWAPIQQASITQAYDPQKDYAVFAAAGQLIALPAGSFAIFMPHDVHMPCVADHDQPLPVRKIVVKVPVE
jgi:YhcH/YjgK/YiaL family protein